MSAALGSMKSFTGILILFFLLTFTYAGDKPVIGFLSTQIPVYEHELDFSDGFDILVQNLGGQLKIIDYHLVFSKQLNSKLVLTLEEVLEQELKKNNITKVIIPGNYYNIACKPHAPLPNKQKVTEALLNLSRQGRVKTLGICGGMQGILHADGIAIASLKQMGMDSDHLFSHPDPHNKKVRLNKIMINPASSLAKIIQNKNLVVSDNGWIKLYMPDYHTEGVDFSPSNLKLLEEKGYKIIGFSQSGVIEVVEDSMGNIHFQAHPEGLILNSDQKEFYNDKAIEGSIVGLNQFFKHFIHS
jgi:anthranilate/para-aminobenzoate synthase component II